MNALRALLDTGVPLVAVSFDDQDAERAASAAVEARVDVAELRVDRFRDTATDHVLRQVEAFRDLPTLVTVRSAAEGGDWRGTEDERLALFRAVAPRVDAVDVELSSRDILDEVVIAAHEHDALVVVSYHNFDHTPPLDELRTTAKAARAAGADIVKISTMARSKADLKVLTTLLVDADVPEMIVIGMGATGTASRIFFPALGSRLTYTFMDAQATSGQLDFAETFALMRRFHPDFAERKN
ncbi:type I 3-dehydroquinate dehydratase [Saccharothrix syringae]|uniref:3-dehydroquinate dehydratase n=1 Tax=Saccharothrix syringae TaxID=103733 RepID=A0A5Q0HA73_SACSY|nr:type I 3-dehydroquinate dehydratase [Saccharothrix syringae]QFZ22552.1 type I 3-dehydroquinate dehydratase [Saccharothrix syringae]